MLALCACSCVSLPCAATDPFQTDTLTAPKPGAVWKGDPAFEPAMPQPLRPKLPDGPLSLAELTDLALLTNPASREAWSAARAEAAAYGVAQSAYLPSLDAALDATWGKTSSTSSSSDTSRSRTRLTPGIGLGYTLFDFGARAATEQAARYGLLAANLGQNRTLQDIVLRVELAYYQLFGATQLIDAARASLDTAQASFDAASAKRAAGLATIGEVYQAETALAQARLQLHRAQGVAGKFKGELASAAGLPVATVLNLVPPPQQPPAQEVKQTVERRLAQARLTRPDLVAAEASARAARARVDAAAAQDKPTVALAADIGTTYSSDSANNGGRSHSVGINVRIPLYNGHRTEYAVREAQARAGQQQAARERLAQQVELEVWQAYFDLETAATAIDSAGALLKSASQSREVAQARYQSGVGTLLDLLSAQSAEAGARVESIQAGLDWYSALSRLNNAIGVFSSSQQSAS
jgi:outer membrane protein TolC